MATAASRYALSGISGTLLSPQAPCQETRCNSQRRIIIRCNAAPKRAHLARPAGGAASRRSLLAGGIVLPFSVLVGDKALAFVDEEDITASERQRRELLKAIQERAAREKAEAEAAAAEPKEAAEATAAEAEQTIEEAGAEAKKEIEEAAPEVESKVEEAASKVESKVEEAAPEVKSKVEETASDMKARVEEAPPKVESKVEEVAPQAESKIQEAAAKVESKIEEAAGKVESAFEDAAAKVESTFKGAEPKVEAVAEEAPKAAAPAESAPSRIEQAAEAVTKRMEEAAESVRDKVQEMFASPSAADAGDSGSKVAAPAPEVPPYGPGSAERIREAKVRRPTPAEKYSGNPDDVNPSDPIYQRMDSSKMPDLPYLFPKENYGTPWVPPADAPKDKIKPFFGPWDIGPQPEKIISRPFKEPEFEETYIPLGMGLSAIATAIGFWIWNIGKPEVNWDLLRDPTGVVQQMKAEKDAFDAAEAERIARGEPEEPPTTEENKH